MFPLLFVLFFLSTMSLPADFIQKDWFRSIAQANPISFLIDGMRGLIIDGWDASTLLPCIAVATGDPRPLLRPRLARAAQAGAAHMSGDAAGRWRSRVLRRTVIHTYKNPAIIIPSLAFPLVFLLAFAGGLSAVPNVPGFDVRRRLHGVPVRLRLPPDGGVRRHLHRLPRSPRTTRAGSRGG